MSLSCISHILLSLQTLFQRPPLPLSLSLCLPIKMWNGSTKSRRSRLSITLRMVPIDLSEGHTELSLFQSLLAFWVWQVEETESVGWKCILARCIEFRRGVHYEKVPTSCTWKPQCCIFTFTSSFSSWLGVSGNDRTARKERKNNLTKQWIVTPSSFNDIGDWGLNVQVNSLHLWPQLKVFSDRCPWCWTPTVTSLNTALPSGFHELQWGSSFSYRS